MNQQAKEVETVIVIGASAGGIDALMQVLSRLPAKLPAAILVVQHLRANRSTGLPQLLAHHCRLRVCLAQDKQPLAAGVVYVGVPGQHLSVEDGHIGLTSGEPVHYVRPSVDVLFISAAQAFGHKVIGVMLSGTGRDGSSGCQSIRAKGGRTIAQDEGTSRCFAMPKAAIEAGAIDYVLPVDHIADKLMSLTYQGASRQ